MIITIFTAIFSAVVENNNVQHEIKAMFSEKMFVNCERQLRFKGEKSPTSIIFFCYSVVGFLCVILLCLFCLVFIH